MISRKTSILAHSFVITALLLILTNGSDAVPIVEWDRTFGGPYWDESFYVEQTPDDGYIIAGLTYSKDNSSHQYAWLIKTDRYGQEQWNRTYPAELIRKVSTTPDGGYILRGISNLSDFRMRKIDAGGQEQWNRTLIVKNVTFFTDMNETSDGGSILAAVEAPTNNSPWWNSRLIKVDQSGNEQWNLTLKTNHEFQLWSVRQTFDGGYVLAGNTFLSYSYYPLPSIPLMDYGDSDAMVIKMDTNDIQQWEKTYGWWGEREGAKSIVLTRDGGYLIEGLNGGIRLFNSDNYNIWLIKSNASGNEQWNRNLGQSWGPFYSSIRQTSDGGYIFVSSAKYDTDKIHDWLIKTDANGNLQWKKVLEGIEMDKYNLKTGYSIKETSDNSYILAGSTEPYGAGNSDAWLIKIKDII
ncbi:MAG: hypothetical protein FIB07_08670 [Candidatus Methanoperedens sp.]|nr:hypothetical protein [Candidatus Methanoperedens sp.]